MTMMTAEALLTQGLIALAMTSVWILFVMVLRRPVTRWLGARWAYRLWWLPFLALVALLLPPSLFFPLLDPSSSVQSLAGGVFEAAHRAAGMVNAALLLLLWVAGIGLFLAALAITHRRQTQRLRDESRALDALELKRLADLCDAMPELKTAEPRVMPLPQGPALAGFLRPVLFLPANFFADYDRPQQRLMLRHECRHLVRNDLETLLLARLFRCLFWFNPLVWLAERRLQTDQELSCDEHVLDGANTATRRLYGETLLQALHAPLGEVLMHYSAAFAELVQRTLMLRQHRQRVLAGLAGACLLLVTGFVAVIGSAIGSQGQQETIREALREPFAEISGLLHCGRPDAAQLQHALSRLRALETHVAGRPLNARETAQLRGLAGLAFEQLGQHSESLAAYQQAARLAPSAAVKPARTHCDLAHSRITVRVPAAPASLPVEVTK